MRALRIVAVVLALVLALVAGLLTPEAAAATPHPATPVWSLRLPGGPRGLAADAHGLVVTTDTGRVVAAGRGGHTRWSSRVDGLVEGTPAVDASRVLVGGRGAVTALARRDGRVVWRQAMAGDVTGVTLAAGLALGGDHAGNLAAFDAATGRPRWSVHYDGRLWSAARVDPAAGVAGVAVATWHWSNVPAVRAFDLTTGALRWEAPTGSSTAAPVVRAGLVVVATGDGRYHARVEARGVADGVLRWQQPVPASFEEAIEPAVDDREVVVIDHFGVVTAFDLTTGALRWHHDLEEALIDTRMWLTETRVLLTTFSGDAFTLDRATGRVVARRSAARLGGYPISTVATRWDRADRLLLAFRLTEPGRVDLLGVP